MYWLIGRNTVVWEEILNKVYWERYWRIGRYIIVWEKLSTKKDEKSINEWSETPLSEKKSSTKKEEKGNDELSDTLLSEKGPVIWMIKLFMPNYEHRKCCNFLNKHSGDIVGVKIYQGSGTITFVIQKLYRHI